MFFTKTHFINFINCERAFYYSRYFPEKENQIGKKMNENRKIKLIIKNKYFNNVYDAKGNIKNINNQIQIDNTEELLKKNVKIIANAAFLYKNLFCVVDILEKNNNGSYNIYEIKTFTNIKPQIKKCYYSLAFQKYILNKKKINIENINIIYINKNYVRKNEINVNELFNIYSFNNDKNFKKIFNNINKDIENIKNFNKNQQLQYSENCLSECPFFQYCHHDLPTPNVTEINGIKKKIAHNLIQKGIVTFNDLKKNKINFNNYRQQIQLDAYFNKKKVIINKKKIKIFLSKLKFPLYFLDFETMNEAIPPINYASPYEQIPFQYSLHIEENNGILKHKEFLGKKIDCTRDLAEKLIKDIPVIGTIISYNAATEKNIIKKLAKKYEDLKKYLEKIAENIIDLLEPFKNGYYYNVKQKGSNSIKNVYPALCKKAKNSYENLPIVHNGIEASETFLNLFKVNGKELEKNRNGLLKYCYLDTKSMVEILKILKQCIKKK